MMPDHAWLLNRSLSRREVVRALAGTAAGVIGGWFIPFRVVASAPLPACVLRPEQTEGPYFVEERLNRSDIRIDPSTGQTKPGTPLMLTVALSRVHDGLCLPLAHAQIDVWHCDALGIYSDVKDPTFHTLGMKFLRGYQITNTQGEAKFLTIYPGWYSGRTVHIHLKVRTAPQSPRSFEFTTQMYFEDALSDRVFGHPPYAARGPRGARNQDDRIFRRGGEQLMLAPTPARDGYEAAFAIGLLFP